MQWSHLRSNEDCSECDSSSMCDTLSTMWHIVHAVTYCPHCDILSTGNIFPSCVIFSNWNSFSILGCFSPPHMDHHHTWTTTIQPSSYRLHHIWTTTIQPSSNCLHHIWTTTIPRPPPFSLLATAFTIYGPPPYLDLHHSNSTNPWISGMNALT